MAVYHVLKDGTKVKDISGHVVKKADAESVYRLMAEMNKRAVKKEANDVQR